MECSICKTGRVKLRSLSTQIIPTVDKTPCINPIHRFNLSEGYEFPFETISSQSAIKLTELQRSGNSFNLLGLLIIIDLYLVAK